MEQVDEREQPTASAAAAAATAAQEAPSSSLKNAEGLKETVTEKVDAVEEATATSKPEATAGEAAVAAVAAIGAAAASDSTDKLKKITIITTNKDGEEDRGVSGKDEANDEAGKPSASSISAASLARTPKHANKMKEGEDDEAAAAGNEEAPSSLGPNNSSGNAAPPRSLEGRPLGGGAFQPTDAGARRQHHLQQHEQHYHNPPPHHLSGAEQQFYTRSPMQISPGGGRYYDRRGIPVGYHSAIPHPGPPPGYYETRGRGGSYDYGGAVPSIRSRSFDGGPGGPPPHYHQYGGPPPPSSHYSGGPQSYDPRYGNVGGDPRAYHQHAGGPPPQYSGHGYQNGPPPEHYPPRSGTGGAPHDHRGPGVGPGGVSRTVSSSFDRSSKDNKAAPAAVAKGAGGSTGNVASKPKADGDASIASDDDSWKQLKQVHSIDDSAIQEHLGLKKSLPTGKSDTADDDDRHPPSNSSSLTNSPTEGPERRAKAAEALLAAAAAAASEKQQSSLDELSSVASAQAPIDTSNTDKKSKPNILDSPATHDSAALDLMKCASGSSALLLPSHQANDDMQLDSTNKRGRDEEPGDSNTAGLVSAKDNATGAGESNPPSKKPKTETQKDGADTKAPKAKSPESIEFSPSAMNKTSEINLLKPSSFAKTSPHPGENSFYDKPPTYSYSLDSAPPLPGGAARRGPGPQQAPGLPPRPGSSASSTLTHGQLQDPSNAVVTSIPSWEIHAQDSFGAGSVGGGHGLANNFSFQDYMLSAAEAANLEKAEAALNGAQAATVATGNSKPPTLGAGGPPSQMPQGYGGPHHPQSHAAIESRNQSFEGGYYHGNFHQTDSMDMGYSGPGRSMGHGGRVGPMNGHTGQFPPHAPSFGSGGSHMSYQQGNLPPGHPYNRMGDYPILRNYSQESAHRASPPPGPPGGPRHYMHHTPTGFQPPPEFAAPHNPMGRRPPPAVYIMSSQGSQQQANKRGGQGSFSWTKDDDIRLTDIMKKYKNPRDWEPIAIEHGMGKTAKECHERWIRYLKPGVRKGQWTDQEDAIVIEAVQTSSEQPFTRWSDLAQRLPGRVGKQIRDRWVNHLNPNINHLPFSREDDLLLWDGHKKLGKRWVEISTKLFNSSRSENHIKNRWYSASFKKFISNEFGADAYTGGKETKGKATKPTKGKRKSSKADHDPATQEILI
eukprot:CAMPEP_0113504798 /NCGR_PEP_ID=MMETSP0014_2-20120614/34926_1 /TAXON_ID=2857 /ORGANISM="Nitzschia sp." /LENGTH=1174 /DNA_ID=CAMNT_0000399969 /DNA_START=400 /DNA_END=3924 /DNA_ORIENTATION=- /assembly_acc=CAM_ASM_000159